MKPIVVLALLLACRAPEAESRPPVDPPEDLVGTWQGVRRAARDGGEEPMTLVVRPVLGGVGEIEELDVGEGGDPYRGLLLRVRDPAGGAWTGVYANGVRGRPVLLTGEVEGERCAWTASSTPGRWSRLEYDHPEPGRWTRTQRVSEDGGKTWNVVFVDTLVRRSLRPR